MDVAHCCNKQKFVTVTIQAYISVSRTRWKTYCILTVKQIYFHNLDILSFSGPTANWYWFGAVFFFQLGDILCYSMVLGVVWKENSITSSHLGMILYYTNEREKNNHFFSLYRTTVSEFLVYKYILECWMDVNGMVRLINSWFISHEFRFNYY